MEFFKNAFIGLSDKNGKPIHEGNSVRLYYKGEYVICKIIYKPEWAMFCLKWPDGYENKFPLNGQDLEVLPDER